MYLVGLHIYYKYVAGIHIDSHTMEYFFPLLFLFSSVVSENFVPQKRMQNIKEGKSIFGHNLATSIALARHRDNWLRLTCILEVFASNLDRKRSTVTRWSSYFALASFNKYLCKYQATTTSS